MKFCKYFLKYDFPDFINLSFAHLQQYKLLMAKKKLSGRLIQGILFQLLIDDAPYSEEVKHLCFKKKNLSLLKFRIPRIDFR